MNHIVHSYRQILRSSSIIGGAAILNILVSLLRNKIAAVLLGPAGVGLIGLLQSLMTTAATFSALGFGMVGTRQIAEAAARKDDDAISLVRRALFWSTLLLALIGSTIFWLFRDVLAEQLLQDASASDRLIWIALGVALSVVTVSQTALLTGLRRIGDLARLSVLSSVLSTVLGVVSLLLLKESGVLIFVLAMPISSFLIGYWYVRKQGKLRAFSTPFMQLVGQWHVMARLGFAFMVSGVIVAAGQLTIRAMVQQDLNAHSLGQFQAAWAISMTYIGFVLSAMGTDYYPRLTAIINDHEAVGRLVNEQTEIALLLSCPVFLIMQGLSPWIMELLYSQDFRDAALVLRWQIMGDMLKVISWPLGFIILASGDGRVFVFAESVAIGAFILATWLILPLLGVQATGIAFMLMYFVQLPLVYWLARRRIGFRWASRVFYMALIMWLTLSCVFLISKFSEIGGGVAGVLLAIVFGFYGLAQIATKVNLGGKIGRFSRFVQGFMKGLSWIRKLY